MSVQNTIQGKLQAALAPLHLDVVNESHMHNVPANSETHFKVAIVATAFEGQRKVARHQRMYQILAEELKGPVHALALHTYTPQEWQAKNGLVPDSPNCLGGSKHDKAGH